MICIKQRAHCFVVLSIISSTWTAREERGHPCHKPASPERLCRAILITEHPPHSLSDVFYHLHQTNKKQFLILPSGEKTYFRIWHYHLSQSKAYRVQSNSSYKKRGMYWVIISLLYPSSFQDGTSLETSWTESLHLRPHVWWVLTNPSSYNLPAPFLNLLMLLSRTKCASVVHSSIALPFACSWSSFSEKQWTQK